MLKLITGKELPALPNNLAHKAVVADPVTGRYYVAEPAQGGGLAPVATQNQNFTIELLEDQVLEYICFKKNTPLNISVGLTVNGDEIYSATVNDAQPLPLLYYATQNTTIYVSGIANGTVVKTKIS